MTDGQAGDICYRPVCSTAPVRAQQVRCVRGGAKITLYCQLVTRDYSTVAPGYKLAVQCDSSAVVSQIKRIEMLQRP